jgi:hypothetical protein
MRIDFTSPIRFGDELTAERYIKRAEAQLSVQKTKGIRWSPAPDLVVVTPNEVTIKAGEALTLEKMQGGPKPARLLIRDLVARGFVLEADGLDDGPQAA